MNKRELELKRTIEERYDNAQILEYLSSYNENELVDILKEICAKESTPLETAKTDLEESTMKSIKKRLPWLITLLFLGMIVSLVVGIFENVVAAVPLIICFQSMVLDMAGNVGTQSLAVTIRVLMDDVTRKDKFILLLKEAKIGLLNGGILGIMAFSLLGIYIHISKGYDWMSALLVSSCVGIALILAILVSSIVGTLIPMLFHKIKIDPAVASGPLITTVNDLVAIVTYYGLAYLLLVRR